MSLRPARGCQGADNAAQSRGRGRCSWRRFLAKAWVMIVLLAAAMGVSACASRANTSYQSQASFANADEATSQIRDALDFHAFETQKPRMENGSLVFLKQFHDAAGTSMRWQQERFALTGIAKVLAPEKRGSGWRVRWRYATGVEASFTFDSKEAATRFADGWAWLAEQASGHLSP